MYQGVPRDTNESSPFLCALPSHRRMDVHLFFVVTILLHSVSALALSLYAALSPTPILLDVGDLDILVQVWVLFLLCSSFHYCFPANNFHWFNMNMSK